MNCYPVFTCSVVALFLCATAQAQAQNRPDFLALDVFGGLAGLGRVCCADRTRTEGGNRLERGHHGSFPSVVGT